MLKKTSVLFFVLLNGLLQAQESKEGLFSKLEYGFNIGWGHEENFLFDDPDYSYDVEFHKLQIYYPLKKKSRISYEILIQPEINIAKHQLHNYFFVTPDETDYLAKRALFTQRRTFTEYVLNIGFLVRKPLYHKLDSYLLISIGPSIINKASERLAKGFAFSDNLAIGLNYDIQQHITLDFRGVIRHVSNADLQLPNGGYNTANFEIGLRYKR
jgi:hypothetical protein